MRFVQKLLPVMSFALIAVMTATILNYQNCSKARTITQKDLGSENPSPTATPKNPNPTKICDTSLLEGPEWQAVWGEKAASGKVPTVRACTTSGPSVSLVKPANLGTISAQIVWASAQNSRPRFGTKKRQADISFLIEDAAFTDWSSFSVMAAYDQNSGSRMGATVTKDTLYAELNDTQCSTSQKLYQGLPVLGKLKSNNWYRLFSQVKDLGDSKLEINVALSDLQSGTQIVQTVYTTTCQPSWYYSDKNSWFFGVSSQTTSSSAPPFETVVNDFNGLVE